MRMVISTMALLLASGAAAQDGCAPWEVVPSPNPDGSTHTVVRGITAIADDHVWAVGSYVDGQIKQLSMRWDGESWTFFDVPVRDLLGDGLLWDVDASDPNNIWAGGDQEFAPSGGFFGTHNLVVRWDGDEWELMDTPVLGLGSGDTVDAVLALAPDDVWFGGNGHPVGSGATPPLVMHWDGSGFDLVEMTIVNPESGRDAGNPIQDFSALSPDDIWAVGTTDVTADGADDYSQVHHWDGSEWTHVPGPTPGFYNDLRAVAAIAPDDVWAGGDWWDFDGQIYPFLIHWDGSQWTQVDVPFGIGDLYAFASDDVYAVSNVVAHWDGASWEIVETFPGVDSPSLVALDATGPCALWAGGRHIPGDDLESLIVRQGPGGCAADFNGDGDTNTLDVLAFLNAWNANDPNADVNGDGEINTLDVLAFLNLWNAGC
ncbi:MAG TPA: GC-type dockerin domain-anchored protein [Phycisphaerales bacterium]|nr:GC-type dockerin domain-anchored protein [Phycisphaerales bacterium]